MPDNTLNHSTKNTAAHAQSRGITLIYLLGTLALLPWAVIQANASLNGDTAWLLIAAQRLLEGGHLGKDVFEINPPLNIFLYAPPVLLAKLLPVPIYYAAFGYFVALLTLAAAGFYSLLKCFEDVTSGERAFLVLGFMTGATIIASSSFGERENILFMGLAPLALVQYAITNKVTLPAHLKVPVLIAGTLAVLLKPHFGLVPAALLIHRAVIQKRVFTILKDHDFIALASLSAIYVLTIAIFAPAYFTQIVPIVLKLYVTQKNPALALQSLAAVFCVTLFFLILTVCGGSLKKRPRDLVVLFHACALLCLVPYAIQMKGYYYHLLPALGFFYIGMALGVYAFATQFVTHPRIAALAALALVCGIAYQHKPPLYDFPTHETYKNLPIARALEKYCQAPCTFFMASDGVEFIWQTALYTQSTHASRFPSMWFLPSLKTAAVKNAFAAMLAEDLKAYQPSTLILISEEPRTGEKIDFIGYFADNSAFTEAAAPYKKVEAIKIDQNLYFSGAGLDYAPYIAYDIYVRDNKTHD